ncbi:UTRA domain-containing protein [Nocardiopsis metallicus]|uniref:DNA-binding GntR family transcriptional regulator n=1 Tax=Nocardiopsis metallicus TaxID=179819 RepID=A0A840WIK5_9ACTN|nr:UTRA domain-containing protein [Nocardiopsis metallicus]MBB5491517.1 DNA-binding GntR family transcriptional regulator [Nocardiopsis metallicus]
MGEDDHRVSGAVPAEREALPVRGGVPILRFVRTTRSAHGPIVEVNDTRMSAERFGGGNPLRRHGSAR